jgi:serine phosphatase RsbU (regulator of sigma subunit)
MFFGVLDSRQLTLTFARAGHNPGIWFRAQPRQIEWLELGGLALGLDSGAIFETVLNEQTVQLAPGDVLIFYTDGFSEARNAAWEEFGEHRLVDSLKRNHELPARNIIQNILFELNTFIKGQPQQDDMTMVAVKVNRNGVI